MTTNSKGAKAWEGIKSVILLLTPVLVAVMGFFFNKSLNKIESQIANVEAMRPFMDMIADTSVTKSKMGAYAIYMLKKDDDPEMAAQMILAAQKEHLIDVLIDLGTRDSVIKNKIHSVFSNVQILDSTSMTGMQLDALKVSKRIAEQEIAEAEVQEDGVPSSATDWLYLGSQKESPSKWVIENLNQISEEWNDWIPLVKDSNVRKSKPEPPSYRLPAFVRVANKGEMIKIDTFTVDSKGHVWASVWFQ
jgi:hypothetical protein